MDDNIIESKMLELTEYVKNRDQYVSALAKAEKKAIMAMKTANQAANEDSGFFNMKNVLQHLQETCLDLGHAVIEQSEAQKKAFENQKKIADVIHFLFSLCVNNMASYNRVVSNLKNNLNALSSSPEDKALRNEFLSILDQLKMQEPLLLRIEKLEQQVREINEMISNSK